jgi:hypothetical protein
VSTVDMSVAAGTLATGVFAVSTLPMMVKARRTRDVRSYSLGNILLGNVGNLLYTVYVLHLPMGPIWALHAFHTVTTALMLYWYLRYVLVPRRSAAPGYEPSRFGGPSGYRRRPGSGAAPGRLGPPPCRARFLYASPASTSKTTRCALFTVMSA